MEPLHCGAGKNAFVSRGVSTTQPGNWITEHTVRTSVCRVGGDSNGTAAAACRAVGLDLRRSSRVVDVYLTPSTLAR
jgi:hypothetical protein